MEFYTNTATVATASRYAPFNPNPSLHRDVPTDLELRDEVYRSVLWMLADVTVTDLKIGRHIPTGMPLTRQAMRAHGLPGREIDAKVLEVLEAATERPGSPFRMTRAVPRTLRSRLPDAEAIFRNWIVPCPTATMNALVCERLLEAFAFDELLSVPGFTLVDVEPDPDYYADPEFAGFVEYGYQTIRLDLDPWLSRRGFIVPIFDAYGYGLPPSWGPVTALKVFRRPDDEQPFLLKSRGVSLHA